MKTQFYVTKNTDPIFFISRILSYVLRDAINDELQNLVSKGILKSDISSTKVTLIVPVYKLNEKICHHYSFKVTVNIFFQSHIHLLSKTETI